MARTSKLTEKQWADIQKRLLDGEAGRVLSREYGISETAIRKRLSSQCEQIKAVANQVVAADVAFKSLPISSQNFAASLIDELKAISTHLAGAAKYGSATAHRLAGIAHSKVQEIDDAAPLDESSLETLKGIAVLTRMANDASAIGVNLLNANKETIKVINSTPHEQQSTLDTSKLSAAALHELLAARG